MIYPVVFVAFCTAIGFLLGAPVLGFAIGCGVILLASAG